MNPTAWRQYHVQEPIRAERTDLRELSLEG